MLSNICLVVLYYMNFRPLFCFGIVYTPDFRKTAEIRRDRGEKCDNLSDSTYPSELRGWRHIYGSLQGAKLGCTSSLLRELNWVQFIPHIREGPELWSWKQRSGHLHWYWMIHFNFREKFIASSFRKASTSIHNFYYLSLTSWIIPVVQEMFQITVVPPKRLAATGGGSLDQCFSTFVRPRPGKFFFHKTRARSQQIYS